MSISNVRGATMNQVPAEKVRITHMLGKFWTAANILSLIRLVLVIPITYLLWVEASRWLVLFLVALGIITDFFDGRVARWSHTVSDWGKVLDPMADKTAAIAVTGVLAFKGILPLWFLILIAARDLMIVIGGIVLARRTSVVVMSLWIGKVAVGMLALTVLAGLLQADRPIIEFCVGATTALLVLAYIAYLARFVRLIRTPPPAAARVLRSEAEHAHPEA